MRDSDLLAPEAASASRADDGDGRDNRADRLRRGGHGLCRRVARGRRAPSTSRPTIPPLAAAKRADYARAGIEGADTLAEALAGADLILSLVTADQALAAARAAAASSIAPGALYCDFNSVAPRDQARGRRG